MNGFGEDLGDWEAVRAILVAKVIADAVGGVKLSGALRLMNSIWPGRRPSFWPLLRTPDQVGRER